jgi:hypothetical protein
MKIIFVFLLGAVPLAAQTNAAPETTLDPAKVAEYQQRFEQGYDLEKDGQLAQARSVYDGILAEQPAAKRSLLEAARISLELNEPLKADAYLDRLHAIVPDFPDALEMLIQANEALRREVKAERLVREYRALHDSGKIPELTKSAFFDREHIRPDAKSEIIISQAFDYTQPPYYALRAELFDAQHQRQRILLLKYDPDGTAQVRAKDPKLAKDEVFILAEPFYSGDRMTRIDVYQELLSAPDYNKARIMLLRIFAQTPKPILSTPVAPTADQ